MEQVGGRIRITYTDESINSLLQRDQPSPPRYSRHFNQTEDFFLKTSSKFEVPSFSIHHDVHQKEPDRTYTEKLSGLVDQLQALVPELFRGLTYTFDPAEILRPVFFQVFRVAGETYLYLLRLDLLFRPHHHSVVERGNNDVTAAYRTNELVLESDVIPVANVHTVAGKVSGFEVEQLISETWIGETGRGYFVQGIWLDTDLTKFFSKLFIPKGRRIYPYYPFSSKFRTVTHSPIEIGLDARRTAIPRLHRVKHFLKPHLDEIQRELRRSEFSDDLPTFRTIKASVPEEWMHMWDSIAMDMYLNDREMKEFEVVTVEPT
jgi:hypothetical protein